MHKLNRDIAAIITREVKENMLFLVDMGMPVTMAMQEGWRLACDLVSYHWTVGNAFGTVGTIFERMAQAREIFKDAVPSFKESLPPSQELL